MEAKTVGFLPGTRRCDDPEFPVRWVQLMADRGIIAQDLDAGYSVPRCNLTNRSTTIRRWRRLWSVRAIAKRPGPKPDLIHAMSVEESERALDLAERWKVPYLLTIDEFLRPGEKLRLSRQWCRGIVAASSDLADELIHEVRLPSRIVSVQAPGIRLSVLPERPRHAGWVPVVGTASGSGLGSGLPIFLEAARRVLSTGVDAEFVVATEASGSTARLLGEGLGVADRLTLAEGGNAGPSFWAVLDLYCHPVRTPCSGQSLANAMAHAIPSIASEMPGVRQWMHDGRTGRIVPPGDSEVLAQAILDLLAHPAATAELGRRGRERIAKDFSIGAEADALASLYRAAAASTEGLFPRVRVDGSGASVLASRRS